MWDNADTKTSNVDLILNKLKSQYLFSESVKNDVRNNLTKTFLFQYKQKWTSACRRKDVFQSKYKDFLEKVFIVQLDDACSSNINTLHDSINTSNLEVNYKTEKRGRPRLSFEEGSSKTKLRRASELANEHTKDELNLALKIKQQKIIIDDVIVDKEAVFDTQTINKALAMFSDIDLSKQKYEKLRAHNQGMYGNKLYPPYKMISEAKNACYPENIDVSDTGASIHIISLLDHTLKRILMTLDEEILRNCNKN